MIYIYTYLYTYVEKRTVNCMKSTLIPLATWCGLSTVGPILMLIPKFLPFCTSLYSAIYNSSRFRISCTSGLNGFMTLSFNPWTCSHMERRLDSHATSTSSTLNLLHLHSIIFHNICLRSKLHGDRLVKLWNSRESTYLQAVDIACQDAAPTSARSWRLPR